MHQVSKSHAYVGRPYGHKLAEKRKKITQKEREESKAKCCWSSFAWERILLETTIKDLREESDRLGYEAEKLLKLESVKLMVTKSNVL